MRTRKSVDEFNKDNALRGQAKQLPQAITSTKANGSASDIPEKISPDTPGSSHRRRVRLRSPWSCSLLTLSTTILAFGLAATIVYAFLTRQVDPKGADMSYMRPMFVSYPEFDTEHTRFAGKYSLYLYREGGIDEDARVKGVPILFIPGNAGSYKQVRPVAAEAAVYFEEHLRHDANAIRDSTQPLDVFSVDFNEDITAFHGQTMLDQAEYLNEAVAYILSLYTNPARSLRDPALPDPSSVMLLGHSMGGIVARTMLIMPNYRPKSVNTIITLAAPHARPPISFDADIVQTYKRVNDFWRESYFQQDDLQNQLSNVALISIAGGGLDTIVPSDYSTIASLAPPSHGLTVFTSTIPNVWTGMDHLAICWCDQLRRSLVRAFFDVADARRADQTKPRHERMRLFERRFLTGLEDVVEKTLPSQEPTVVLTLEDNANSIASQGERLVLRELGHAQKPQAHVLPIPPQGSPDRKRFTLLTDQHLDGFGAGSNLTVLFCNVFPLQSGQASVSVTENIDLSSGIPGSTRLACKNAAPDTIVLPASTKQSQHPFDHAQPFSYLQFNLETLSDHQFVAIVDRTTQPNPGWVVAEFSSRSESWLETSSSLQDLVLSGLDVSFGAERALMNTIHIPAIHSSLLAYKLQVVRHSLKAEPVEDLFTPLLRQYIADPYESKFFVNVKDADIAMHGVAPYLPPPLRGNSAAQGLFLQIWSDPTTNSTMKITLQVDIIGSMGKFWMRYRTVFAAFPLLVVALVLRKQFQFYDSTGVFMSFSESMDQCLRRSVPVMVVALTFLATSYSRASQALSSPGVLGWSNAATETPIDYTVNDLVLGSQDPFFWFLVPLFGLISIGICIALNYAILTIIHISSIVYLAVMKMRYKDGKHLNVFADTSLRKRLITTSVLLLLASTIIPHQFVFMVLCCVQIATCVRVLSVAIETVSSTKHSRLLPTSWLMKSVALR